MLRAELNEESKENSSIQSSPNKRPGMGKRVKERHAAKSNLKMSSGGLNDAQMK